MRTILIKRAFVSAVSAVTATAAIGLTATSASADPDPITGGTTLIDVPIAVVQAEAVQGIFAVPTKPATVTYDQAAKTVEYSLPVTGGDGSIPNFYGDVKHGGGLILFNARNGRSVNLTNFDFRIQDDTLSATPAGSTTPVVLFDANGQHDFQSSPPPESFSASQLQVDPAGAAYLDKALNTKVFKAGQTVGSFSTSFTNSNDS